MLVSAVGGSNSSSSPVEVGIWQATHFLMNNFLKKRVACHTPTSTGELLLFLPPTALTCCQGQDTLSMSVA